MNVVDMSGREAMAILRVRLKDDETSIGLLDVVDLELADDYVVPGPVFTMLRHKFPRAGKRTFDAVQRRCSFCWRVWQDKYGPLTTAQAEYAAGLMRWCIENSQGNYAFLYANFDRVVNHEDTDAGFKRRAEETVKFDLQEVLS